MQGMCGDGVQTIRSKTMKIFTDKAEIYAAIRSANKKLKELRELIAVKDAQKRALDGGALRQMLEDEIIKLEAKAGRIESVRLVKLSRTLAAFQTETFDFMGDYKGVPTQKI